MEDKSLGKFCGSILLSENIWDKNQLLDDLKKDWEIEFKLEDTETDDNTIISDIESYRIVISKFPAPVPNQEAEMNAQNNFMWEKAVEVTSSHKAHIVVAILGDELDLIECGLLYTKIMSTCTKQKYAIGVFTSGVVFEPSFYYEAAQVMKENELPVLNWIWFGFYKGDEAFSAYTYGMNVFGNYEMEVLFGKESEMYDAYDFVRSIAAYVLSANIELKDGETIGFSKDDIHKIKLSKGIALPNQDTLKISY